MPTTPTSVRRALADERGLAMITALLAVIVAATLGATVMRLSFHTTETSAYDRARTQAVHAAEAGLNQVLEQIATTETVLLPCTASGQLTATPVASWSITVDYYATYPLSGSPMTCTAGVIGTAGVPLGAIVRSTGSVTAWPVSQVERVIESQVKLNPIYGGYNKAVFSDNGPNIGNSLTISGADGANGDFYTNGSWNCQNNITINGSVAAQGGVSMGNQCTVAADLWANGSITMSGSARVNHDVKSSTGSLTMSNFSEVGNSITLGTTCSGCAGRYGGTLTENNASGPPPQYTWPSISWAGDVPQAWQDDGYSVQTFTSCDSARSWITDSGNWATKAVVRITGGCTLSFTNANTPSAIARTEDLAIFTDGEITSQNQVTFSSGDSDWHNLYLIVDDGSSCAGSDGDITLSNQTQFTKLYYFVYSPCTVNFANNNSGGKGQIYGVDVTIQNLLTFQYHPMLVPGASFISGYTTDLAFVREID